MATPRYSTLDPAALGADLVIERGGIVLTFDAACNINRMCRATDGKSAGVWEAEWRFWGDLDLDGLFTSNDSSLLGTYYDTGLPQV